MTDPSPSDPAARLEAALERIARRAAIPSAPAAPDPVLVARLDGLILHLQRALDGEEAADGPDQP